MPLTTEQLANHYGVVYQQHKQITDMTPYEMVCYLQRQFNHNENDLKFGDKEGIAKAFKLLTSENNEMHVEGLKPKDLKMLRDAIADQITIAYFLAFKIDQLHFENFQHIKPLIPRSYTEYADQIDTVIGELQHALLEQNSPDVAQDHLTHLLACLHNLPEASVVDLDEDLLDITFASLSKVCANQEIADRTLAAYQERGYVCHIEQVPNGFGIFVTEDCTIRDEVIPKGKFLKSLELISPILAPVHENPVW